MKREKTEARFKRLLVEKVLLRQPKEEEEKRHIMKSRVLPVEVPKHRKYMKAALHFCRDISVIVFHVLKDTKNRDRMNIILGGV